MAACGIICEYNPFHTGHAYQINCVKEQLKLPVVCAMSGNFTQRATGACMDKHIRAKIALSNGADVVLELPFPFSSMSANGFANAGVHILAKSGLCSHIAFGSECGDIEVLTEVAKITLRPEFEKSISDFQKQNPSFSYARARSTITELSYGKTFADILSSPNDILAVEYIKANISLGQPLIPVAIKRTTPRGSASNGYASSSYIRECIYENLKQQHFDSLPESIKTFLPKETKQEDFATDDSTFEKLLHIILMTKQPEELWGIAEVPKGSQYALTKSAHIAKDYKHLTELMKTKSFTDAKIRRMVLFSAFGVKSSMLKQFPLYTSLLAYTKEGQELLSQSRKQREIIIASKLANIKQNKDAYAQYLIAHTAEEVLEKCRSK